LAQQDLEILQADNGIENWIDRINSLQVGLHHLAARELPRMNGFGEFLGAEFGGDHGFFNKQ